MRKYRILVVVLIIGLAISISTYVKAVEISTREELIQFSEDVNSGNTFEGETIYLKNDIDLNGSEENQWIPIGRKNKPFKGTFEGNGHSISGIYISNGKVEDKGLFGYNEGTIRNIGVKNAILDIVECNGSINLGTIVGRNIGTIQYCYNSSNIITEVNSEHAYTYIGGIVGCNEGIIEFCYNIGNMQLNITNAAQICAGTIVGHTNENSNIRNCYNIGNIGVEKGKVAYLGYGMIGHHLHGDISKCYYLFETSENGRGYNKEDEENIIESRKSNELKEEIFLSEINEVNNLYFVKDTKNINNGYPILYWQKEDTPIVTKSVLKEIKIKTPPVKIDYTEGEKFDKTGMVVVAIYSDGIAKEITSYTISPQEELKKENEYITISYTEGEETKSVMQKITVNGIKQNQKDNTISSNVLPDTGKLLGIVLIIALVAVVVVLNYINTKRYKDI